MVKLLRLVFLLLTIVLNSASLLKAQVTSYPYSESFESGLIYKDISIKSERIPSVFIDKDLYQRDVIIKSLGSQIKQSQFGIVTHGRPGELFIDGSWKSGSDLVNWIIESTPSEAEEILIFGCSFGQDNESVDFVKELAELTGKAIYASNDITGIDGDWTLEVSSYKNLELQFQVSDWNCNLQTVIVDENSFIDGSFTVTQAGTYYFEVVGAEGGEGENHFGGEGAIVEVSYSLQAGDVIEYIVGEGGEGNEESGGGGGSSGFYINGVLAAVAGAGAGGDNSSNAYGSGGRDVLNGQDGTGSGNGNGGTNGDGGTDGSSDAGAGGGVFSDGEDNTRGGEMANNSHTLVDGGSGDGDGGRGLTGGGAGRDYYPGGGGGYSGGGAGGSGGRAGGGGSYVNTTIPGYITHSITAGSNGNTSGANENDGDDGEILISVDYSSGGVGTGNSFENSQDGWANIGGDFDWINDQNGTPSSNTGPSVASDGTYYMYTEVSSPVGNSENGYLVKEFDLTAAFFTDFEFDYHMYGSMINEFSFQVSTDGGSSYTSLFTETGDQGNVWNSQSIDLSAYYGQIIFLRFAVETPASGDVWQGDVAVDNVSYTIIDVGDDDFDGDGLVDYFDLDDDNDGVLDIDECGYSSFTFSGGDGGSSLSLNEENVSSLYVDFYELDNSASITINGGGLNVNNILQVQDVGVVAGEVRMVLASDDAFLTQPWLPNSNGLPRMRVIIDEIGYVQIYGSRTTTSVSLELMKTLDGSDFNFVNFSSSSNSIDIVNPDDIGLDGVDGEAFVNLNCDSDLDGISNKNDLDSDGDGCSDAFESGATSDETSDYQFSDVNGDQNGLSPSVDPSATGAVNYTLSSDFIDASEVSCSCPFSNGLDNDGDVYDEYCDQDDDNDGVFDVDEYGSCGDGTSIDWDVHYFEGSSSNTGDQPAIDAATPALFFDGTTTVTYSQTENITSQGESADYRINDTYISGGFTFYQEALFNARSTHKFEFSEPVYNLNFTIYDVDEAEGQGHFQDYMQVKMITSNGAVYQLQPGDYTTATSNEYIGSNTFRGITDDNGSVVISSIGEWIVSLEFIYYNGKPEEEYDFSDGDVQGSAIGDIGFCTAADSDGDGIIDAKEVDSDDDGCPDAIEAGFTYEDIHLQGSQIWEQDTTIADTGVPDGAGVPTNSFVTNAASQGPNCEAFFVLAVELNEFIAYKEESDVQLYWSTLTEKENDYFRVMWRTDNSTWEQIGKVTGAGYSEVLQEYRLLHENPEIGNNYYKIIAIDFNGDADESQTRIVNFSRDGGRILLYPNPNKDRFSLANVDLKKFQNLRIYNMQGKLVDFNYDFNGENIDIHHQLSAGAYFLEFVYNNGENKRMKFIVK